MMFLCLLKIAKLVQCKPDINWLSIISDVLREKKSKRTQFPNQIVTSNVFYKSHNLAFNNGGYLHGAISKLNT